MVSKPIAYFPGCSLHGLAKPFDTSTRLVCNKIGIALQEPDDWNCCGATSAHSIDHTLNLALGARNLNLVAKSMSNTVTAPCAACYSNLKRSSLELQNPQKRKFASELVDDDLENVENVNVIHLLELLSETSISNEIKASLKYRFSDLNVVCYYGCLTVRPNLESDLESDSSENPQSMDRLLGALGADVRDWSHKSECCGGSHSLCGPELANIRTDEVLRQAIASGADVIAVACPLCHSNLEFRLHALQARGKQIPVVFFTQLIGLAMGFTTKEVGLNKLLVNSFPWREKLTLA
ncbi:CoB--CoM heterodisulfide reductase iron-sulfur subunit B family protein [Desulfosporosinus sp.]|uniref:CoB--CoM heterodisulfide reductase iron-sulfur subunit B family protein n=1 Tax=Desulfosporosinus sp. TaxID=157907 RepID=UPI0025C0241B|nr:CoB--CoM heterodisulfide reductase iron-sulfur subunit B family protein [Desulfosporosinus sp.]MBC2723000.1 CoB--CoM heterodisulfide reductase iron-sulfur subunit B family protein [Desulfosporosinus sp.]MBC2728059.1 CoB--CoM heterodisulfide reductase iron-sulfur subunit B family protein [Desulfosporosinus sp.]